MSDVESAVSNNEKTEYVIVRRDSEDRVEIVELDIDGLLEQGFKFLRHREVGGHTMAEWVEADKLEYYKALDINKGTNHE